VIPKDHSQTIDRMSDDSAAACARALVRVSRAVAEATGVAGWNVLQNNGKVSGQEVGHVHFHVIPRRDGDELGYRWLARSLDSEAAAATAEAIRKRLDE